MTDRSDDGGSVSNGPGPTVFEVSRRLDEQARAHERLVDSTTRRLDALFERVDRMVAEAEERFASKQSVADFRATVEERVRKIEDRQEWVVRGLIASVIATAAAALRAYGGA